MPSARTPLMAGNWKSNLNHQEAVVLVQKLAWTLDDKKHDFGRVEVVVVPPYTDIRTVQTLVDGDKLLLGYGAQDLSPHPKGAYTGDISGAMLAKLGCQYVVVGHSERRQYHHEDDALVNTKVKAAQANELVPIVCIGEGLETREAGEHVPYVIEQLDAGLDKLTPAQVEKVVVAYEPVWAIGTGKTATPDDAQEVCGAIRARLAGTFGAPTASRVRVLYGGSVKANNVAAIMAQPDVDGALVGGASINADEFAQIVRFPEHLAR